MGEIRKLYNQIQQTNLDIEALKPIQMLSTSINYQKNRFIYEYSIYSGLTGNVIKLEFNDVPEEYLQNIRIVCLANATDGDLTSQFYKFYNPTFIYFIGRGENNKLIIRILIGGWRYYPPQKSTIYFKIIFMNPREQYELRTRKS